MVEVEHNSREALLGIPSLTQACILEMQGLPFREARQIQVQGLEGGGGGGFYGGGGGGGDDNQSGVPGLQGMGGGGGGSSWAHSTLAVNIDGQAGQSASAAAAAVPGGTSTLFYTNPYGRPLNGGFCCVLEYL